MIPTTDRVQYFVFCASLPLILKEGNYCMISRGYQPKVATVAVPELPERPCRGTDAGGARAERPRGTGHPPAVPTKASAIPRLGSDPEERTRRHWTGRFP